MPTHTEPTAKHEKSDVSVRFMAYVVVGLALLTLGGMAVSWWYLSAVEQSEQAARRPLPPLAATLPETPPEPRLQVVPAADLTSVRQREDSVLNTYGWIDRRSGLVRIPIDRAIEVLAERGLPSRAQGENGDKATAKR